jgi:DNA polymerase III delta prime subunit
LLSFLKGIGYHEVFIRKVSFFAFSGQPHFPLEEIRIQLLSFIIVQTFPLGVLALFSGPSGTGKTMAADVIARELRTSFFRVNYNHVVSKYIGETEKNLARVFETAQKKGAVLFLMRLMPCLEKGVKLKMRMIGMRRVEVSYLLAKAYRGLVILTSNRKVDVDPKIACRVKYLLKFPPTLLSPLYSTKAIM